MSELADPAVDRTPMTDAPENAVERFARAAQTPTGVLVAGLLAWMAWAVVQAPADATQGIVYKILFVHAPAAFAAYLGFILTAIGGGLYLWRNDEQWDRLAIAAAEVGVLFCTINIVTGPIWGKAIWGKPWVWDPRLIVTALLWITYLSYTLLRSFSEEGPRAARFAAVYGIAGVLLIPLNYFAIDLFGNRAMHPENLERGSLGVGIGLPFLAGTLTTLVAFLYLLWLRIDVGGLRAEAERRDREAWEAEA